MIRRALERKGYECRWAIWRRPEEPDDYLNRGWWDICAVLPQDTRSDYRRTEWPSGRRLPDVLSAIAALPDATPQAERER